MNNLQKMINSSKNQLQKQESLVMSKLAELDNYIDILTSNNDNVKALNQEDFSNNVNKNLTITTSTLSNLKNSLIKEKNSNIYSKDVKCAITTIAKIKNSLKNAQIKLIKAQNACAMRGDIASADNLAKISLELNYHNHMFVKNASADVVDLKQIIQN